MAETKAFVVPFSHMDLFWLGAQEECLSRGNRIIAEVMEMAGKYPEFRFLLEDLVFVDHFLRCHPEGKEEFGKLLDKGQIEVGPKWAGIDQAPQLGEDLVRNSLYSMAYLNEHFGYAPKTMHTGDLPGWTPQYPQILQKLGIPYAVYTRGGPTDVSLFYWVGLDGTKELVWYSLNGYGWAWHRGGLELSVDKAMENGLEKTMQEVLAQGAEPIFVHWGVDLILPGPKLPENLKEWNRRSKLKMAFATPTEYFQHVPTQGLRDVAGEVPSAWPYSEPQYPHHMLLTFPAVTGLLTAEHYSALAWQRGFLGEYPGERIREEWLLVLEAMDHNNNGQGYDLTRERKRSYLQSAVTASVHIREDALRRIAEKVRNPFDRDCYAVVIFNPLPWPRTEVVTTHATFHGSISAFDIARYRSLRLLDEQGTEVAFEERDIREGVAREHYLQFTAVDVPACGYTTYYVVPSEAGALRGSEVVTAENDHTFVTPFYRFIVDEVTGEVSILDRSKGGRSICRLRIVGTEEELDNGSFRDKTTGRFFEAVIDSIRLSDNGQISAAIEVQAHIAESTLCQSIEVYRDSMRIDISNEVDFRKWRPMRLEQVFAADLVDGEVNYGVAYGTSGMENVMPNSGPFRKDELPRESWSKLRTCIHWLDMSGPEGGITVGSPHRCYSFDKGVVRAVMLRAVVSTQCVYIRNGKRVRHERPYPGSYRYKYSLLPHTGSWRSAKSYRCGWDLNFPLLPVVVGDASSAKSLPARDQFVEIASDTESLILDVVKRSEDGESLVLRFHETEGRAGTARVSIADGKDHSMRLCDLHEQPIDEVSVREGVKFRAYDIVTLRIEP